MQCAARRERETVEVDDFWPRVFPASASHLSVDQVVQLLRALRREDERVFVVVHAFAGRPRAGDIEHYTLQMAEEIQMRLVFLSVDLDVDARWDLGLPHTFHQLSEAAEEGLLDVLLGPPPARLGAAQGSCRHRVPDRSGTVASIAGAFPGLRRLSKRASMRPTPWPSTS